MIAITVYLLCAATAMTCAILLIRSYRKVRTSLQFWSAVCFTGLAVSNLILVIDLVVLPQIDLRIYRNGLTLVSGAVFLYGLIAELTS